MRKRLFIFAAATCFALSAFATPAFAEEPSLPDGPTICSEASGGSEDALPNVLQAWINSNPATSTGSATFTLDGDFTTDQGLLFTGDSTAPADSRQTFIIDAQSHNITLNDYGIGATYCNVIIKNCNTLTIKAHRHKVPEVFASACYFGHATLTLDNCTDVTIQNDLEKGQGGSGISVYGEGSLYFKNKTKVAISGYMANNGSGIYMDRDDYDEIMGSINVDDSTLTISDCHHNGITANPANINVTGGSVLTICDNNTPYTYGTGGLGCYFGKLTVAGGSSVVSTGNTGWGYGIFVGGLEVDGDSNVDVSNNGSICNVGTTSTYWDGTGLAISGNAVLHSGATVTSHDNWGIGIQLYYDPYDPDSYPGGPLTVESGATLSSTHNGNYGMANACTLTVKSGAHVHIEENIKGGLDNYPGATTTVEKDADFVIENNFGRGIKNGNAGQTDNPGILVIESGLITENHTEGKTPSFPGVDLSMFPDGYTGSWGAWGGDFYNFGGGIYNECGTVSLSTAAKVYNNHAKDAGDDLYNYEDLPDKNLSGNIFNITTNPTDTKAVPGASGAVLKDDNKFIDYWYRDGKDNRWNEKDARQYTEISLAPGEALKAAHGINAPTPSPKPVEPTAAPTEAPTPTAVPTTVPTAAPTAAPTTAPADNTATAAPATPAPTARPTVTATPAPTAQASGVIPQTGDSSSPALFSILTLGSITALCVLQKRRKSK